jgi:GDP-fucose transporter C1
LFFLFSQLIIAVLLFLACHASGLLKVPLQFDRQTVEGLIPMMGLNVIGLRFASARSTNSVMVQLTGALFTPQF